MYIELGLFYFFSSLAIISATMVISLTNAVHSVLFLILVFCNMSGLLLISGAEFLAFLFLIVYVGAIAVLFLFVVMMLNIKSIDFKSSKWSTLPLGIIMFSSLFFQFSSLLEETYSQYNNQAYLVWNNWILENNYKTNVGVIGNVLYTKYSLAFLISGFILLIAMIGAIVLTMHQKTNVKKQHIDIQLNRNASGVIKFIKIRK